MPYKRGGSPYYQVDLELDGYPYRIGARTTKTSSKRVARRMEETLRDLAGNPDLGHEALDALREGRLSLPRIHSAHRSNRLYSLLEGDGDPPLEQIVDTFLTDTDDRRYEYAMDRLLEVAPDGARASWLLDHRHVQEVARCYREQGYAAGTEAREMAGISQLLRQHYGSAKRDQVWQDVDVRRPDNRDAARPLTGDEVRKLREQVLESGELDTDWWVLIGLALSTGLRRGELMALEGRDVDLEGGQIRVRSGKSRSARRRVPLEGEALMEIRRWREEQRIEDGDPLFPGLTASALYRAWQTVRSLIGLPGVRFHDLRHTYGRMCAEAGMPMPELKERMGHKELETTMRYSIYRPGDREAYRRGLENYGLAHERPTIRPTTETADGDDPGDTGDTDEGIGIRVAPSA